MVLHKDKWKVKASRAYHRKHKTNPNPHKQKSENANEYVSSAPPEKEDQKVPFSDSDSSAGSLGVESGFEKAALTKSELNDLGSLDTKSVDTPGSEQIQSQFSKRPIIESNAWRYEEFSPDSQEPDEEIDYTRLPAREFEISAPKKLPLFEHDRRHLKHEIVKPTRIEFVNRSEYSELESNIDKANAIRAFRERFSTAKHRTGNVSSEQSKDKNEEDFDDFMNSLSAQKKKPNSETETNLCGLPKQTGFHDEEFLDSLLSRR